MDFINDSPKMIRIYKDFLQKGASKQKARQIIQLFIRTGGQCIPLPLVVRAVMVLYDNIRDGVTSKGAKLTKRISKIADKIDESSIDLNDALSVALQDADQILGSAAESERIDIPFGYEEENTESTTTPPQRSSASSSPNPSLDNMTADDMALIQSLLAQMSMLNGTTTPKMKNKQRQTPKPSSTNDLINLQVAPTAPPSDDDRKGGGDGSSGGSGGVGDQSSLQAAAAASSG